MQHDDELLTGEAAARLGISPARVHQLADRGQLASRRVGERRVRVFDGRDVETLRAARQANPPRPGRKAASPDVESGK